MQAVSHPQLASQRRNYENLLGGAQHFFMCYWFVYSFLCGKYRIIHIRGGVWGGGPLPKNFFKIAFSYWCISVAHKCCQHAPIRKRSLKKIAWGGAHRDPSPDYFCHLSEKYNISVRAVRIYKSLQHSQGHSNPLRDCKQKLMFI